MLQAPIINSGIIGKCYLGRVAGFLHSFLASDDQTQTALCLRHVIALGYTRDPFKATLTEVMNNNNILRLLDKYLATDIAL